MTPPSALAPPLALPVTLPSIHLGEVDHLDRDHGLQEPGRGEMRAEAALMRFWRA